jgi:hypothetical protein
MFGGYFQHRPEPRIAASFTANRTKCIQELMTPTTNVVLLVITMNLSFVPGSGSRAEALADTVAQTVGEMRCQSDFSLQTVSDMAS